MCKLLAVAFDEDTVPLVGGFAFDEDPVPLVRATNLHTVSHCPSSEVPFPVVVEFPLAVEVALPLAVEVVLPPAAEVTFPFVPFAAPQIIVCP